MEIPPAATRQRLILSLTETKCQTIPKLPGISTDLMCRWSTCSMNSACSAARRVPVTRLTVGESGERGGPRAASREGEHDKRVVRIRRQAAAEVIRCHRTRGRQRLVPDSVCTASGQDRECREPEACIPRHLATSIHACRPPGVRAGRPWAWRAARPVNLV